MKPASFQQAASAAATSSPKPSTLEKVARAIEVAEWRFDDPSWSEKVARAALHALRQVDDETVEAAKRAMIEWHEGAEDFEAGARSIFTAAIDHILSETGRAEVEHGG